MVLISLIYRCGSSIIIIHIKVGMLTSVMIMTIVIATDVMLLSFIFFS